MVPVNPFIRMHGNTKINEGYSLIFHPDVVADINSSKI
jgi:hypothetical protein